MRMKLLDLLENQHLTEITLNPSVWQTWSQSAQAAQIKAGFEAELIVPVDESWDDTPEPNYDENPQALDIEEVVDFYSSTHFGMNSREANALRERMQSDFVAYVEDKLDDAFAEQGNRMVRDIARAQGMDAEQTDELIDSQSDEYTDLSDHVRDQLRDQLLAEIDERDWLRSAGIRRMSDVESEYNVTWPIWWTPDSNNSAEQVEKVAQDIRKALGVKLFASTSYHTAPRMADAWVLEPDSSIKVHDEHSQTGLELITPSPPYALPDTLRYLDYVFAWATSYGCETNLSTGFHMSMSLPPEIHDNLDPVKLILLLGDKQILANFGRSANTYAKSAFEAFVMHVNSTDNFPVQPALDALRAGMFKMAKDYMGIPFMDKYISVHVKPTYVEFRHAGGDYLDQLPEIKNTMLRMAYVLNLAADDAAARPDYARKLYKLLGAFNRPQTTDAVINLFTLYNAGIINADVLKRSIQSMRKPG
jgi:hypothetical protein